MHDALRGTASRRGGERRAPWLCAFAVFLACCTLLLICSGGLVTSKNAGLAVPDWPNSFGYSMFAFPVSRWVGAVLLEHTHRLLASGVGLLTVGLAVWLARTEPRRWLRTLGYAAVVLVILQGVLGGLRVRLVADWIGIFHACVAQAFLALVSFIALATSSWWQALGNPDRRRPELSVLAGFGKHLLAMALLIYVQLALGAAMRHAHAGLSVPDFPRAYGHWWPQVHKADLPALNRQRTEVLHQPPTTLAQIHLQMTHRVLAIFAILPGVLAVALAAWRRREMLPESLRRFAMVGSGLVLTQVALGIYTIWSNKAADIATAHVAVGASLLVWSVLTYAALQRWRTGGAIYALQSRSIPQPLEAIA